jgi:hypothetical protein
MREKALKDDTARGRDDRWRDAHQSMVAERKEAFIREDGLSSAEAEAKAKRLQERATNRARARAEGRD